MKSFLIGIALSLGALIVSRSYCLESRANLVRSRSNYDECGRLVEELVRMRSEISDVAVAPPNYDYARDLIQLLAESQMMVDRGVSLASSRVVSDEGTFVKKAISNPISRPVSLDQIVTLLSHAEGGEIRYYVEAIELTAPAQKATIQEDEHWTVSDIELSFFEAAERP